MLKKQSQQQFVDLGADLESVWFSSSRQNPWKRMMDVFVCVSVFMEAPDASRLLSEVLPGSRQLHRRNIKAEKPETSEGL